MPVRRCLRTKDIAARVGTDGLAAFRHPGHYYDVAAALVAAGANVTADIANWDKVQTDPKMLAALKQ